MMDFSLINVAYFLSGIYSLILVLIGTPLNLLCFYIYTRLVPNRSNPTIIVFAHLALIELLIPFTWNINYVVRELIWKFQRESSMKNLEQHSLFICKLISYSAYFSLQCAAWLKTLATFARCVTLHHHWPLKKWVSKPIIIRRMIYCVIIIIGLLNFPIWIVNGEESVIMDQFNQTQIQIKCYQSKFFQFWEIIHLLLYNFLPFTLMILCNILIVRHVRESRRRTQRSKSSSINSTNRRPKSGNGGRLTKALILITVFFILFTAPAAIFYIFFGKRIRRHRDLITMTLSNLATTSHVTSFLIYWLTSGDFKDAALSILSCRPVVVRRFGTEDRQSERTKSHPIPSSPPPQQIDDETQRKL